MSSYISNRDIPVFVTVPMIFSCINKIIPYVRNGKMGARNSVANELRYDNLCSQEYVQQMLSILIRYRPYIYTIILLKSVAVHKLQATLLARLSREMSQTVRID